MAIFTVDQTDSSVEAIDAAAMVIELTRLFGAGHTWILAPAAAHSVSRVRQVHPDEAHALCLFFLQGRCLSDLRQRMSPEDWHILLGGLPDEVVTGMVA